MICVKFQKITGMLSSKVFSFGLRESAGEVCNSNVFRFISDLDVCYLNVPLPKWRFRPDSRDHKEVQQAKRESLVIITLSTQYLSSIVEHHRMCLEATALVLMYRKYVITSNLTRWEKFCECPTYTNERIEESGDKLNVFR